MLISSLMILTGLTRSDPTLTNDQHRRIEQISSVFENGTTEFEYGYIEDIDDGAGVTAGRVGFNTAHGSLLNLVKAYTEINPKNSITPYLSCLTKIIHTSEYKCLFPSVSSDVLKTKEFRESLISHFDFGFDFIETAKEHLFVQLQDKIVEQDIYAPSIEWAKKLNIKSALGVAMIYDTILQTGAYGGMGLEGIISRMTSQPTSEPEWLSVYMESRLDTLKRPFKADGTRYDVAPYITWPRAEALIEILKTGNLDLNAPISFSYFNESFVIKL